MMGARWFILILMAMISWLPAFARAEEGVPAKPIVADISDNKIAVDTHFNGAKLLLFGARNANGDVVVVVRGPEKTFTVRKKERVAGIWVNRSEVTFEHIPAFYNVAASRPLDEIRNQSLLSSLQLGFEHLLPVFGDEAQMRRRQEFSQAFLNRQEKARLYLNQDNRVHFIEETLFKMPLTFPDSLSNGTYTVEIYLFNNGQLMGMETTPIQVIRTGFDSVIYNLAHQHSALYGMLAVIMALSIGWGAGRLFEKI